MGRATIRRADAGSDGLFLGALSVPGGDQRRAGVRYIGKQWADDANTERLPSVTLLDAMVRADLGVWSPSLKGAFVQVNANNLSDRVSLRLLRNRQLLLGSRTQRDRYRRLRLLRIV